MKKLVLIFFSCLAATAAETQFNLLSFGADPSGQRDSTLPLTRAIAIAKAQASRSAVYVPPGMYRLTNTVEIPSNTRIYGDLVDATYKDARPGGAVFYTSGNFTAFRTPRLSFPTNTLDYWASAIYLANLTIMGTNYKVSPETDTFGLDLTGIRVSKLENLNVQGYGRGILIRNCSEMTLENILLENNYVGFWAARDPATSVAYDCHITIRNMLSIDNQVNAIFENPRALFWDGGQLNSNWTNRNVSITNCSSDTQIVVAKCLIENHSDVYANFELDTNGVGSLKLPSNNFGTDRNMPWVVNKGFHDNIEIIGSSVERSLTRTNPLVWLQANPGATNYYLRTRRTYVQSATHQWFDSLVRDDQVARPEEDYVPTGYINLNPLPNTDHAGDGLISVAGDYTFLNTNTLCGGLSRVMWQNVASNNVYSFITPTNMTRGYDHLYVIATVYDNNGANVPHPDPQGWGDQGVGWSRTATAKIGEYTTADGVKFSKWAWTIVAYNPSLITNGLTAVNLYDVYGTTNVATKSLYGLERFCVYANSTQNPYGARIPSLSATPTGLNGRYRAGTFLPNNNYTANPGIYGWLCTETGFPGTFRRIDSLSVPDIFGTLSPGLNTWGDYYRGYGANTGWPFSAATIYDASSVDQYLFLNGLPLGGTKVAPTFAGSNSGGNFMRSRTAGAANDSILDFGFFTSGSGVSGTTLLSLAPSGAATIPGSLAVAGQITTPLFNTDLLSTSTLGVTNSVTASNYVTTALSGPLITWSATNAVPANTNAVLWIKVSYSGSDYAMPLMKLP